MNKMLMILSFSPQIMVFSLNLQQESDGLAGFVSISTEVLRIKQKSQLIHALLCSSPYMIPKLPGRYVIPKFRYIIAFIACVYNVQYHDIVL